MKTNLFVELTREADICQAECVHIHIVLKSVNKREPENPSGSIMETTDEANELGLLCLLRIHTFSIKLTNKHSTIILARQILTQASGLSPSQCNAIEANVLQSIVNRNTKKLFHVSVQHSFYSKQCNTVSFTVANYWNITSDIWRENFPPRKEKRRRCGFLHYFSPPHIWPEHDVARMCLHSLSCHSNVLCTDVRKERTSGSDELSFDDIFSSNLL